MRTIFIISFLANLALALVSLAILPDRVAIHFGLGGTPDGWASNLTSTLIMLTIDTILFVSLYFSPRLLEVTPSKWISLPNRDYWLAPERRPKTLETFSRYIWQFGAALFLFMLVAGILSLKANLSDPVRLDEESFLIALAIFLVYTAWWTVSLIRAFRIPR